MITKNKSIKTRGDNGFTSKNAKILQESIISAKHSDKYFKSGSALIQDAL